MIKNTSIFLCFISFFLLCFNVNADTTHLIDGASLSIYWIVPFIGMLLSIALFPVIAHQWWEKYFYHVTLFWILLLILPMGYYLSFTITFQKIIETIIEEYLPFIIILFSLYTVTGGIVVKGKFSGTPLFNTLYLAGGSLLASWIGTTGASMLLIRPLIKAIQWRHHRKHIIIFFIFLVANIGGSLTPIGDPPLFLGFLKGIDFTWPLKNMAKPMLFVSSILLTLFYFLDKRLFIKDGEYTDRHAKTDPSFEIHGKHNLVFVGLIISSVLISSQMKSWGGFKIGIFDFPYSDFFRDIFLLLMAYISYKMTSEKVRTENHFSWLPIQEVAVLFIGIFITMIPSMSILQAGMQGALASLVEQTTNTAGQPLNMQYFWITGFLSSFLDNAPTYLVFFNLAGGDPHLLMGTLNTTLLAISTSAVFMGANTYIGNAPNLMVKSIATSRGIQMPGFFGYIGWSIAFLIPTYLLFSLIFFFQW